MDKKLKERYEAVKSLVQDRRPDFGALIAMLETETSWLDSPASTRFHLAEQHGLLRHSVGVAETLLRLRACLAPQLSEESCAIVGLLHDAGKVGMPQKPLYLPNPDEWQRKHRGQNYVYNDQVTAMGLAVRSLYLVAKYLPLSDAEAQAICYHDGQYVVENEPVALKEEPLLLLLHWADYWTMRVIEDQRPVVEDRNYYRRATPDT
jgi:hypothetical protein